MSAPRSSAIGLSGALGRDSSSGVKPVALVPGGSPRCCRRLVPKTVFLIAITRVRAAGQKDPKPTAEQPALPGIRRYSTVLGLTPDLATNSPTAGLAPPVPLMMPEDYLSSDAYRRRARSLLTPVKLATGMKVRSARSLSPNSELVGRGVCRIRLFAFHQPFVGYLTLGVAVALDGAPADGTFEDNARNSIGGGFRRSCSAGGCALPRQGRTFLLCL